MTNTHSIPDNAVLVAIDIAKTRNDVLVEIPGHKRRRRLVVLNTRVEHDRFVDLLLSFDRPVIAAFEATGNYHRAIAWRLLDAGFETRLISSMALARTREAIHNGWDKNDPKDAQVILHMLRTGLSQYYQDPLAAGISDIQELSKTHEMVSKAKTETMHRILTHYLPLYFPEIERFRQNSRSDWFFAFLEQFPTPSSIVALNKEDFIAAAWDVVGRKVMGDVFGAAALGTLISVAAAATEDLIVGFGGLGVITRDPVDAAVAKGAQRTASNVANRVVDRGLALPPTISAPAGTRVSVIVTRRTIL